MLLEHNWIIVLLLTQSVICCCLLVLLIVLYVRQRSRFSELCERYDRLVASVNGIEDTLTNFIREYEEEENSTTEVSENVTGEEKINTPDERFRDKVMLLIAANYTNPSYTPAQLIQDMCMSRSLFHRKSTLLLGQSAGRLINAYRMEKAKSLILSFKEMNISDVAYAVGFSDPKYFTRSFTKYFGCSPTKMTDNSQ